MLKLTLILQNVGIEQNIFSEQPATVYWSRQRGRVLRSILAPSL